MLGIAVNFGLHAHELHKNFQIGDILKLAILLSACDHVLVDSSL